MHFALGESSEAGLMNMCRPPPPHSKGIFQPAKHTDTSASKNMCFELEVNIYTFSQVCVLSLSEVSPL